MTRRRPDVPALVAGLVVAALGALLLANELGDLDLGFAWLGPAALAALGAVLLASGLSRRP
jgi:hypothetical protein